MSFLTQDRPVPFLDNLHKIVFVERHSEEVVSFFSVY